MSETAEFWRGQFGIDYSVRNRPDPMLRVSFWQSIIARTHARSILEIGCNIGTNLKAIRTCDPTIELLGIDVSHAALNDAAFDGFDVEDCSAVDYTATGSHDLVFTSGVLIHIPGDELSLVMDNIIRASKKYVLAVEYADEVETEVEYRGFTGRLWRRPFGKLYQDKGLTIISSGPAPADAFDACEFWILEKAS